jgi:hypothetical protein
MSIPDDSMRVEELVGRLAVLGVPPKVTRNLSMGQVRGIFMTLAEWLDAEPGGDEPLG